MADLEDRILRQNVPGRWSSLDTKDDVRYGEQEDNQRDETGDGEDEDGSEKLTQDQELLQHAKQMDDDGVPDPIKRRILAERERMPGTGVKGVLADYKTHLKLEQARKDEEKRVKDQIINRMVNGARIPTNVAVNPSMESQILLNLQSAINQKIKSTPHEPEALDFSDDDDDEFEDEAMIAFRQQRMQEMIALASSRPQQSQDLSATGGSETSLPRYGECIEALTTDDFLHHIDQVDPRTTVILHVYDPLIRACQTLNQHLHALAHEWIYVKFILMNIDVNEIAIDRVALPALSVYRGGDCINVITAIAEELASDSSFHSAAIRHTNSSRSEQFSVEDIKWLLETSEGWNGVVTC